MYKRKHDEEFDERRQSYNKKSRDDDQDLPDLHMIFHGEVSSLQQYGAFVKIPGYKKEGLVHKSQMSQARVEDPSEMVAVKEKVYCKIISMENNKIGLSMKAVNQTTGQDLDPNNVQSSLDERKKQAFFKGKKPKIELGAELNTTCSRCGKKGHLPQDCFHVKGDKQYDLIPEDDDYMKELSTEIKKDKKVHKKHKKEKKKKSKKSRSKNSSDSSDGEKSRNVKSEKKHKKHKKKHEKSTHDSSSD